MNPFSEKLITLDKSFQNWKRLYPKSYDKNAVDPYTKTRIILANGAEFEANWFLHQFARHVTDDALKRELALTRAVEKEQQIKISLLKPANETQLEHTIGYEQLAVDLTAELAKRETDCNVKQALDFALLEDFDHLYRYADLLQMTQGIHAEHLVGGYTEIMPGRPTAAHHRYPKDNVRFGIDGKKASTSTMLATMIITAAEQQTMNYYMNVTTLARTELARRLYQEIALVEEEHVTHYESLQDPNSTWLECWLWHEYCECYLYWSNYETETDPRIKAFWEENFAFETAHLQMAAQMLQKYEKKDALSVIRDPEFPAPLSLHENIEYVRDILKNTVQFTSQKDGYVKVDDLPEKANFFAYQKLKNANIDVEPSHRVIDKHIERYGKDYRYCKAQNPVEGLRSETQDNVEVGRKAGAAKSTGFTCNAV